MHVFNAHIEASLLSAIGNLVHTLHTETGSHVFLQVVLHHKGEPWQMFRGNGQKAADAINRDYPAHTPLCHMTWLTKDPLHDGAANAAKRLAQATSKKPASSGELQRKEVRDASLQLTARDANSLSRRTIVPSTALRENKVAFVGFQRDFNDDDSKTHCSNTATYLVDECKEFLRAFKAGELSLEWSSPREPSSSPLPEIATILTGNNEGTE